MVIYKVVLNSVNLVTVITNCCNITLNNHRMITIMSKNQYNYRHIRKKSRKTFAWTARTPYICTGHPMLDEPDNH